MRSVQSGPDALSLSQRLIAFRMTRWSRPFVRLNHSQSRSPSSSCSRSLGCLRRGRSARAHRQIVTDALVDGPGAGATVKVVRKGEVIVDKGYGKADLELDVPMTEKTSSHRLDHQAVHRSGIMRLVEEGKLGSTTTSASSCPTRHCTARRSRSRSCSRTRRGEELYGATGVEQSNGLPLPPARLYELLKDQPLDFAPGQKWHYSNTNYYLLGLIIEKVSGQKYRDFLRDEVTARAGLAHTVYCDDDPIIPGRARGYSGDGPHMKNAKALDMSAPFAAGGLCSTVDDLVQWAQALASGKVVSPASYARMTTPVKPADGSDPGYGFGLGVKPMAGIAWSCTTAASTASAPTWSASPTTAWSSPCSPTATIRSGTDRPQDRRRPLGAAAAARAQGRAAGRCREVRRRVRHQVQGRAAPPARLQRGRPPLAARRFDGSNDRLDYLGPDEFMVHGAPFHVRITPRS